MGTFSVYVAGPSAELERVRAVQAVLRMAGHTITHDWVFAVEMWGQHAETLTRAECQRQATDDLAGVVAASVVLVLWPRTPGAVGTFVEFGAALAQRGTPPHGCLVVISGGASIWHALADHVADTDELAVEWVIRKGTT